MLKTGGRKKNSLDVGGGEGGLLKFASCKAKFVYSL